MIIDGNHIASELVAAVNAAREGFPPLVVRAVVVAPTAATRSYLKIKSLRAKDAGMELEIVELPDGASTDDCIEAIEAHGADAVIVQLPLPEKIDAEKVLDLIPAVLDADVLGAISRGAFAHGLEGALLPPVVGAVKEILERANVSVSDAKVVVVGDGWLVGNPVSTWFTLQGAKVSVVTKSTPDLSVLGDADIVVSGAGSPHLIQPDMLKEGVVLIDAGTSEANGVIAGDMAPACADIASVFTPVPGGVGPIAVACLFRNVLALLALHENSFEESLG